MRSLKILGAAFFAVLAFGVVAATSASAAEWLKGGVALTKAEPAETHGLILLESLPSKNVIHCTGTFHGTVGPGDEDTITLVLGLSGEKDLITCTVAKGAGGLTCLAGSLVEVHAENLPWKTLLEAISGSIFDRTFSSGKGLPKWHVLCKGSLSISCEGEARALFEGNGTNGAKLNYKKEAFNEKGMCSNGETAAITSEKGEVLGFTIS